MKRIICIFSLCGMLVAIEHLMAFGAVRRAEIQPFPIERYKKVILDDGRLYMSNGQGLLSPYYGMLFVGTLAAPPAVEMFPAYSGVYVEDLAPEGGSMIPIGNHFPFCWDIAAGNMLSLNIIDDLLGGGGPEFAVMSIPLNWLTASSIPQDIRYPLDTYGLSEPYPLFRLFSLSSNEQRARVFFDLMTYHERELMLYLAYDGTLHIRKFHQDVQAELRRRWDELSNDEYHRLSDAEWKEVESFPIDFEGPFWVIPLGTQRYVLSEVKDTVYRLDADGLTPVLHLPVQEAQRKASRIFVIDKDREQLSFFLPAFPDPTSPTMITIGAASTKHQDLEPALRSLLDMYGEKKQFVPVHK